jgi:GT2 family glycosyltransferase
VTATGTCSLDLSIIIVNWNSGDFLRKCLESVYAHTKGIDFEVIIVDNGSFDSAAGIVKTEFPSVRFIQSPTNLGFAKANNLGVSAAQGRNLLFLNPDTEIIGASLRRMSSFLDRTPRAGIAGCKLLNTDGSLQTTCVQPFPSILNQAVDAEYLRRTFPRLKLWGMQALLTSDKKPAVVEMICGACLMIKAEVFKSVGQFTSNYFMYAEETDLCFKTMQAGLRNYYLGDVAVVHHGGGSSVSKREDHSSSIMMRQSLLEFMRLRRGSAYAAAYRFSTTIVAVLRLGMLATAFLFSWGREERELLRSTFSKWVKVLRWSLGLEGGAGNGPGYDCSAAGLADSRHDSGTKLPSV